MCSPSPALLRRSADFSLILSLSLSPPSSISFASFRSREMMFSIQFTRVNSTIDCSIPAGIGWANENISEVYFNASRAISKRRAGGKSRGMENICENVKVNRLGARSRDRGALSKRDYRPRAYNRGPSAFLWTIYARRHGVLSLSFFLSAERSN